MKKILAVFIVFFATMNGLYAATSCVSGMYLSNGWCLSCGPGNYCDGEIPYAQESCTDPGYFCPKNSTTSHGESTVLADGCEIGAQCTCAAGYYCPETSTTKTGQPLLPLEGGVTGCGADGHGDCECEDGYYCPLTSTTDHGRPVEPSTVYRTIDGVANTPIICAGGETTDCTCRTGTYCPAGSETAPISCSAGTYQPDPQMGACIDCNSGYYCSAVGSTSRTNCPAGDYCATTGLLTAVSGPCDPGYFCPLTSSSSHGGPVAPPAGITGCGTDGHSDCACPAGTYNSLPRQDALTDCLACTTGQYCPGIARTTHPTCEMGYYCPSIIQDHQLCTAGYFCPTNGATQVILTNICLAGFFCPETSRTNHGQPVAPPEGVTGCGTDGHSNCPCSTGYYCPTGSQASKGQPIVTRQVQNNIGTIFTCAQNSFCDCPTGNRCPFSSTTGTTVPTACLIGYYQDEPAQDSCIICPAGTMCPLPGMSVPQSCPSQTISPEGNLQIYNCYIDTATTMFVDDNGATGTGLTLNQIIGEVIASPGSDAYKCYYNDIP